MTELLPCNQDEHIEEQEMSNRCQNNDEREANLVSLLQNAITDSAIIDVTQRGSRVLYFFRNFSKSH